jgi:Protein of unknown function (DUF1638)
MTTAAPERLLVLACGALAREVLAVVRANRWEHVDVHCLPAKLHVTPDRIPGAVDEALAEAAGRYDRVFVGYADCGTAGALDGVLERHGAERLPGAHCYAVYAGLDEWDAIQEEEPGTYYLTDFLTQHFDSLVWRPLGLDRHPELRDDYFHNYRRVIYLSQADDPALLERARACAQKIRLPFEHRPTGYGLLGGSLAGFSEIRCVA